MSEKISKTFTVDGEVHELKFDMAALCLAEELTGKPSGEIFSSIQSEDRFSFIDMCHLFHSGLMHKGDVTRDTALSILNKIGVTKAGELIGAGLKIHFSAGVENEAGATTGKK